MTHVWFVLPDGSRVASEVISLPRKGDLVRFAADGMAFEITQVEHIATDGSHSGLRHTTIVMRLSAAAA